MHHLLTCWLCHRRRKKIYNNVYKASLNLLLSPPRHPPLKPSRRRQVPDPEELVARPTGNGRATHLAQQFCCVIKFCFQNGLKLHRNLKSSIKEKLGEKNQTKEYRTVKGRGSGILPSSTKRDKITAAEGSSQEQTSKFGCWVWWILWLQLDCVQLKFVQLTHLLT